MTRLVFLFLVVLITPTHAELQCSPLVERPKILLSANAKDVSKEPLPGPTRLWLLRRAAREGQYLRGDLSAPRGAGEDNTYALSREWRCAER